VNLVHAFSLVQWSLRKAGLRGYIVRPGFGKECKKLHRLLLFLPILRERREELYQGWVIVVLQGCVIDVLQGCVIVALQGRVIVALLGSLIVALQGCVIVALQAQWLQGCVIVALQGSVIVVL
jgi:hypothetical protein